MQQFTTKKMTQPSKKAAYFTLLGMVIDQLPKEAPSAYIASHPNANAQRVISVTSGTTKDLPLLVDIVETVLPGFAVPEEIKTAS